MDVLYYAMRYRVCGGNLERDRAHEADMKRLALEQLRLDCEGEDEPVVYQEPWPLEDYDF